MLNKLLEMLRRYEMVSPGDQVVCALSGGADSVALLYAMYLLKDRLEITLSAAHFNHHLRGEESDRDAVFSRNLCQRLDIPFYLGEGDVVPGKKGLENAAREARYDFLLSLPGKIFTAHTADDNGETVLMRLIRGTGLKGLGGIPPVSGRLYRPMLTVTRREVEEFLKENNLRHIEDSSNGGDDFLRNRIRHEIMPLLSKENPRIGENLSAMALTLRLDEEFLSGRTEGELPDVSALRTLHPALRRRYLAAFLIRQGVREPEQSHIALAESLVFSDNPSARGNFPGNVVIARAYDRLVRQEAAEEIREAVLPCPGSLFLPWAELTVTCQEADAIENGKDVFTIVPQGQMILRTRRTGDTLRLSGGEKSLKKRMIDEKIPAALRGRIPVLADEAGILGVYSMGADLSRRAKSLPAVTVRFIKTGRKPNGK